MAAKRNDLCSSYANTSFSQVDFEIEHLKFLISKSYLLDDLLIVWFF